MAEDDVAGASVAEITDYVDVTAPPPGLAAHVVFGTNQVIPVELVARRYHDGLAPLVIATGGINRHDGIVEGREIRRSLVARGVPAQVVRCEDRSANTRENVEFSLPYLTEAVDAGLPVAAVCKWYHRRAIHCLGSLVPGLDGVYAITYEPVYSGVPVTRTNWMDHPDGKRRVLREWQEVPRRVADGSFAKLARVHGAWRRISTD
jgi:uncharacterized SAM-binding protein YcdF (DUF218 family)